MSEPTNYADLFASNGAGESALATVQSTRAISSTSIIVDATTNFPTGTFIATTGTLLSTGKLNPTTAQVFYGTASGTTITIVSFAAGYTDNGNAIDDVVVIKPTTEWANIVASGLGSVTQFPATFANFVEPAGGVWSTSSGLVGSQTAGNVWYNGVRSVIPVVTSHTFTASKDTYVDFNPATSAFTYVAVTNGAAEPAVTASCVRVAKVVTGSSTVSSIYQTRYQSSVKANSVLSSMLGLSNALNPETGVQSQANAGTAGGTMYYINLGGIKLLWMTSASLTQGSPGAFSITFPTSFFTTVQFQSATLVNSGTYITPTSISTTAPAVYIGAAISGIQFTYFAIGT